MIYAPSCCFIHGFISSVEHNIDILNKVDNQTVDGSH